MMPLLIMFVAEGERLSDQGKLEQAMDSLNNAIACRECSDQTRADLQRIIASMWREHNRRAER